MVELMADGYKIDLEELGKFYPTLECEGAESIDDFDPDKHIKADHVNWEPGEGFKDLKQRIVFRKDFTRRMQKETSKSDM